VVGTGRGVVARVIDVCLRHAQWSREDAEKAVREIVMAEAPRLNSHLHTLAVIAAVAPLLGLLGTVSGMIRLFTVITHYGTGDPRLMAGGISEALITTQTGLAIAIPILLMHNFLRNRRNKLRTEIERTAVVVLNRLWPTKKK
jgi:biopolymer transport protein ExbB